MGYSLWGRKESDTSEGLSSPDFCPCFPFGPGKAKYTCLTSHKGCPASSEGAAASSQGIPGAPLSPLQSFPTPPGLPLCLCQN